MIGDATDANGAHFVPSAVTVHVGDIVEWDYDSAAFVPHNIVFANADSLSNHKGLGAKADGSPGDGTWQVRFSLAGQYNYVCTFHPGMTGTVTVG
jgi:plastocyanin